jgi:penicillin-binding protein 1A
MVRMMEGVITHGTGVRAGFGRIAAGKTGTSQNWRDAWFIGFTPDWICGVWVGNDDGAPMYKVTGGEVPAAIWKRMMVTAHGDSPPADFTWMPPPTPATAGDDAAASGEPDADIAADIAADPRGAFYDDLANDFDKAEGDRRDEPAPADLPPSDADVPSPGERLPQDRETPGYRVPPAWQERPPYPERPVNGAEPAYRDEPALRSDRGAGYDVERQP